MSPQLAKEYYFDSDSAEHTHTYLWSPVETILSQMTIPGARIFELGCGNGAFARRLATCGYDISGVDPSTDGISRAIVADPQTNLVIGSAYDPLAEIFGTFPAVISLEVVEHVYFPRLFAKCVCELLEPGGFAIISTPYHGYWKNLALAILGKMDGHFTALWDHGHIKFWSIRTLTELFREQKLTVEKSLRVGRIPALAKSMILIIRKPQD